MHYVGAKCIQSVLVGIVLATAVSAQDKGRKPDMRRMESKQTNGLQLAVSYPATTPAGEPVGVKVHLVNGGSQKAVILLDRRRRLSPLVVVVADKTGVKAPLTAFGQRYLQPSSLADRFDAARSSLMTVTINAGASRDLSIPNLGLFYDLTLPGTYEITIDLAVTVGDINTGKETLLRLTGVPIVVGTP
jgi:hypothetical protein